VSNSFCKGYYDEAVKIFTKAIDEDLRSAHNDLELIDHRFYLNRGDCYRMLNKISSAIVDYKIALSLCPDDWEIRTRLALAYYASGIPLMTNCFIMSLSALTIYTSPSASLPPE
jgi:tetratricopeptide (TPR) repeat protein